MSLFNINKYKNSAILVSFWNASSLNVMISDTIQKKWESLEGSGG